MDTNVIVSSLFAESGTLYELFEAWRNGDFLLLTREDIISEVVRTLGRPYYREKRHVTDQIVAELVRTLRTEGVETAGDLVIEAVAKDPDDNKILACAIEAQADYVVSGDHHLLELGSYRGIPIVRPAEFLLVLGAGGR